MSWNPKQLSENFKITAENAEKYFLEIKEHKLKRSSSYKLLYDEYLAKFYVYNYLGENLLESKQSLLTALNSLLESEPPLATEAIDRGRFNSYWKLYIKSLIKKYSR